MDHRDATERPHSVRPTGPPDRADGEAIEAKAARILLWFRVLAAILVIAPLGLVSCAAVWWEQARHADSESWAETMRLLMIPAGVIVAALLSVIAGGGRGWLAIAACSVGGLAIAGFGLLGLTEFMEAWWPFRLYFVAVAAVGGALIVGAYLRLGPLLHARGTGRS